MEKIEQAVARNEMDRFLIGIGDYACWGYSDLPRPNDYEACWKQEIIPYARLHEKTIGDTVRKGLLTVLDDESDKSLAIYTVVSHIGQYCIHKFRNNSVAMHVTFNIDLSEISEKLRLLLAQNKDSLLTDYRWAGMKDYSKNGMWGPMMRWARHFNELLTGLNFVPDNAD